jgi:hypothetical protein
MGRSSFLDLGVYGRCTLDLPLPPHTPTSTLFQQSSSSSNTEYETMWDGRVKSCHADATGIFFGTVVRLGLQLFTYHCKKEEVNMPLQLCVFQCAVSSLDFPPLFQLLSSSNNTESEKAHDGRLKSSHAVLHE